MASCSRVLVLRRCLAAVGGGGNTTLSLNRPLWLSSPTSSSTSNSNSSRRAYETFTTEKSKQKEVVVSGSGDDGYNVSSSGLHGDRGDSHFSTNQKKKTGMHGPSTRDRFLDKVPTPPIASEGTDGPPAVEKIVGHSHDPGNIYDIVDVRDKPKRKVPRAPSYTDLPVGHESKKGPVETYLDKMRKSDRSMVFGSLNDDYPVVLPDNPAEIAYLAPAQARAGQLNMLPNGQTRRVIITQRHWLPDQSTFSVERHWYIDFEHDNESAEKWSDELMGGWASGSDPMAATVDLQFRNALDAVNFCKKNGWIYAVNAPIHRSIRMDGAQYQDNFLSQKIAHRVKRQGMRCAQWKRSNSGTSHYFRPINYHGNGIVKQHGLNPKKRIARHVEGYMRRR